MPGCAGCQVLISHTCCQRDLERPAGYTRRLCSSFLGVLSLSGSHLCSTQVHIQRGREKGFLCKCQHLSQGRIPGLLSRKVPSRTRTPVSVLPPNTLSFYPYGPRGVLEIQQSHLCSRNKNRDDHLLSCVDTFKSALQGITYIS